tara:strand:- start:67 stop:531 length:465 start_codon:yes stop_codon:yes gene_type:complete
MKNYILIIITFFFISNCNLNKVVKHHGVHFLEKKQNKLVLFETNKNDIISLLGPPSTKSSFDNDVWIYIERKTTVGSVTKLARKKLLVNNVLILEINNAGMLVKKDFLDKNQMEKIKISENKTNVLKKKRGFIYDTLQSLRQKINDPLGKNKIN